MPKLEIRETGDKGAGVYATEDFGPGGFLLEFEGPLLSSSMMPFPIEPDDDHYIQIGSKLYLGPSGKVDDFVNHSCEPNAKVLVKGLRAWLVAIRDISAGDEITFDYSTTSTDTPEVWALSCRCGTARCRGTVSGFQTVPRVIQDEYIAEGAVPEYVTV